MRKFILFIFVIFCTQRCFSQVIADSAFIHHQIVTGIDQTTYIFEGEVINTQSYFSPAGDFIYTSNQILVHQIWKEPIGRPLVAGRQVEVITRGGTVGNESLVISHQIGFSRGQKGMFFCDPASFPADPNSGVPPEFHLQLHDGIYIDYDYSKHYISASFTHFKYNCIDLLYQTIDPDFVIQCIDVYPNGILQELKYSEFISNSNQKLASANSGSGTITYSFENASTVTEGGINYFEFDIYVASTSNVYFDNGLVRIIYNTDAFDTNIVSNNGVTVQRGDITASYSDYFDPSPADISGNVLAIGVGATIDAQNRHLITATPQQLIPSQQNWIEPIHFKFISSRCGFLCGKYKG